MEVRPGYKQSEVGVIPAEWNCVPLKAIARQITDGDHATPHRSQDGYFLLSARNVRDGNIDLNNVDYVGPDEYERMRRRCAPEAGDLLLSCSGHGLGRVAVLPEGVECVLVRSAALVKIIRHKADSRFIQYWLQSTNAQKQISDSKSLAAQPNLFLGDIEKLLSPLPLATSEQGAIAEALSDADALIESIEHLLAKKRQIKQGAMQALLTGQKRMPGFNGEWRVKPFGEVAQPRKERVDPRQKGVHDFCIELEHIEPGTGCLLGWTATDEGSSLKSVFSRGDVLFGKLRAYLRKFWLADRTGVCSTEIWPLVAQDRVLISEFLFQLVSTDRFVEAASSAHGTHMPRSDWKVVKNFEVLLPSLEEQTAIARVLSDMDLEVAALQAKLAKARQLKQGMMQELLSGRIRLV